MESDSNSLEKGRDPLLRSTMMVVGWRSQKMRVAGLVFAESLANGPVYELHHVLFAHELHFAQRRTHLIGHGAGVFVAEAALN